MSAPSQQGARIALDGRVGTLLSFRARSAYAYSHVANPRVEDRRWVVVFDDAPEAVALIAVEDQPRVTDITPKLVRNGAGYTMELPDGTHRVFKRGAYWYRVAPGALPPSRKEFSGINTRDAALSMVLSRFAAKVDPR